MRRNRERLIWRKWWMSHYSAGVFVLTRTTHVPAMCANESLFKCHVIHVISFMDRWLFSHQVWFKMYAVFYFSPFLFCGIDCVTNRIQARWNTLNCAKNNIRSDAGIHLLYAEAPDKRRTIVIHMPTMHVTLGKKSPNVEIHFICIVLTFDTCIFIIHVFFGEKNERLSRVPHTFPLWFIRAWSCMCTAHEYTSANLLLRNHTI